MKHQRYKQHAYQEDCPCNCCAAHRQAPRMPKAMREQLNQARTHQDKKAYKRRTKHQSSAYAESFGGTRRQSEEL